ALCVIRVYVNPAPPDEFVISTGNGEGDYDSYAKEYADILKRDGINLVVRRSSGARENLERLANTKSDVDVAFVQDGLDIKKGGEDLVSLGSLYYEPMW